MAKVSILVLISAALILSLSGCGYKAPPYYEKPIESEGANGAL